MPILTITPNIQKAPWSDLDPLVKRGMIRHQGCGRLPEIARAGRLPNATANGCSTACVVIHMPDGETVIAETTLKLFWAAALAMKASAESEGEEV